MIDWIFVSFALCLLILLTLFVGYKAGAFKQTLVALSLQTALSIGFYLIWGLRGDAQTYHQAAIVLSDTWANGLEPVYTLPEGKRTTVIFAGFIYWLTGPVPYVVLLFTSTMTALLPTLLSTSTKLFGFTRAANYAAWLGVFAPPLILWAPWLTREFLAFIVLGMATVVFSMIYRRERFPLAILLWLSTAWVMSVTRPQLLFILATGTVAASLLRRPESTLTLAKPIQARLFSLIFLTLSSLAAWWTLSSTDSARTLDSGVRTAIAQEVGGPEQNLGVSYLSVAPLENTQNFLQLGEWFQRGANSLIGPFPWEWESLSWAVPGLDGMMMLLVWGLIIWGAIKFPATRRMTLILVAASLPLIIGEAYIHANYGITMRVRAHYLILFLPLIAVQVQYLKKSLQQKRKIT